MLQHDIIDNRQERLVDHIRTILATSRVAKFAVGYFFVSGLEGIADHLSNVEELSLLIGNTTNRETIEQLAEGYQRLDRVEAALDRQRFSKRSDMQRAAAATAAQIGTTIALMEQTDAAVTILTTLVRLIDEGRLHVRVYTKGRLHAKAYIFTYGPVFDGQGNLQPRHEVGTAIVGSSNLTLAGITQNTELNVMVPGNENHAALTTWFDELWSAATEFDATLMEQLQQSWALATIRPYDIYLKALYTLVQDRVEGGNEEIWSNAIFDRLADFQKVAVRQAVQIIRDSGGVFIADVVGLGKSYIGAAIVRHFVGSENARPLIICPAPLVEMWERYNEVYQLHARVLSMGFLREGTDGPTTLLNDPKYRERDFVLIDESHNFRHPDTQRYHVLQAFLATGRKVCLLTATPRSKTAWDLYHQIKLFHPEEATDLPITPPHLKSYFSQVEIGKASLPALLAHLLIRRTRSHILRWYGYDAVTDLPVDPGAFGAYQRGERQAYVYVGDRKQFFPRRQLTTIDYSIEATYQGLYEQIRAMIGQPQFSDAAPHSLTYARYGLWRYVDPARQKQEPYATLRRAGTNLHGLIRMLLFKRFESSVYAFRTTIERLIAIHARFLVALDAGIVPAGDDAQSILYEAVDGEEADLAHLIADLERATRQRGYVATAFDLPRLRQDIVHDLACLRTIAALVGPITPDRDAKLQRLRECLEEAPIVGEKCLIFTQYADTARYLAEQVNPGNTRSDRAVIYSQDRDKARIVARFAPRANPESYRGEPEIQILIATDVLAEGLNLQDGNCLINYDLHWNPVRLIQRFGRIDRIGSDHAVVYGFNFLPELGIEANLGLREKLHRRIQEIHDTIGEDAAILDATEQLNEQAMYAIYEQHGDDLGTFEEESEGQTLDLSEAEEILRKLREDDPAEYARIAALKDGIRTARHGGGQDGVIVLAQAGTYRQLYLADREGQIISRDLGRILSLLQCDPAETGLSLPEGYNRIIGRVHHAFATEVYQRQVERAHTVALTAGQRYVLQELRRYALIAPADDGAQLSILSSAFRGRVTESLHKRLNALRLGHIGGRDLFIELIALYEQYGLRDYAQATADPVDEPTPRIICSEGLVW